MCISWWGNQLKCWWWVVLWWGWCRTGVVLVWKFVPAGLFGMFSWYVWWRTCGWAGGGLVWWSRADDACICCNPLTALLWAGKVLGKTLKEFYYHPPFLPRTMMSQLTLLPCSTHQQTHKHAHKHTHIYLLLKFNVLTPEGIGEWGIGRGRRGEGREASAWAYIRVREVRGKNEIKGICLHNERQAYRRNMRACHGKEGGGVGGAWRRVCVQEGEKEGPGNSWNFEYLSAFFTVYAAIL